MQTSSELQPVQLRVTEQAIAAYAELTNDYNPIHIDAEFAARTPMGKPIAHGTMSLCLIWKCLQRNFGASVFQDLELDVRFVKPVYIGELLTAGGEADTAKLGSWRVWVRGDDGTDYIVGTVEPVHSAGGQPGEGA